jgi:hypothetical protein
MTDTETVFSEPGRPDGLEVHPDATKYAGDIPIRNYRYWAPMPGQEQTGDRVGWTRCTTFAKAIADYFGLHKWDLRNTVIGMAMRPDLVEQVGVIDAETKDGKTELDEIVAKAQETAGSRDASRKGTSIHRLAQAVEEGRPLPKNIRADVRQAVEKYLDMIKTRLPNMPSELAERLVCNPSMNYIGRLDRLNLDSAGVGRIVDLKSGQNVQQYGGLEISIQMALYTHATHMWNPAMGLWEPMPKVHLDYGLIAWCPVGGDPDLLEVDIVEGWNNAQLCQDVRMARTKAKGLITSYTRDRDKLPQRDPYLEGAGLLADLQVSIWEDKIRQATSKSQLSEIRKAAMAVNEWTPDLLALGMERLRRLELPTA